MCLLSESYHEICLQRGKKPQQTLKLFTHMLKHIHLKDKWKHFCSSEFGILFEELSDTEQCITDFPCWLIIPSQRERSYVMVLTSKAIELDIRITVRNPRQMSILLTRSNHPLCMLEYCNAKSLGYQLSNNKSKWKKGLVLKKSKFEDKHSVPQLKSCSESPSGGGLSLLTSGSLGRVTWPDNICHPGEDIRG